MPPSCMTTRACFPLLALLLLLLPRSVQLSTGASFTSAGGSVGNRDSLARPITSLALKWRLRVAGRVRGSPVVSTQGTAYVADSTGHVYGVGSDGQLVGMFDTGEQSHTGAAQLGLEENRVYVAAANGTVHCLQRDLSARHWVAHVSTIGITAPPVVTPSGHFVVGTRCGNVVALHKELGTELWRHKVGGEIGTSLSISSTGTIYVAAHDGRLYAIEPGEKAVAVIDPPMEGMEGAASSWTQATQRWCRWVVRIGNNHMSSPSISPDGEGQLVIGNDKGRALAFDLGRGLLKWNVSVDHGQMVFMTPVHVPGANIVLLGASSGMMVAVTADGGDQLWSRQLGVFMASPVSVADGSFYVTTKEGCLLRVESSTGSIGSQYCVEDEVYASPVVAADGTVLFTSTNGHLHALSGKCSEHCVHGHCDGVTGQCICDEPFKGAQCVEACPGDFYHQRSQQYISCSGHGRCNFQRLQCECDSPYGNHDCASITCPAGCTGHGECVAGSCVCGSYFWGAQCQHVRYNTWEMWLLVVSIVTALVLGSGVLYRASEVVEEVKTFRREYAQQQPERMLGASHHFGSYRPTRLEAAAPPRTPLIDVCRPQQLAGGQQLNMFTLPPPPSQDIPPPALETGMRQRRGTPGGVVPHSLANRWNVN